MEGIRLAQLHIANERAAAKAAHAAEGRAGVVMEGSLLKRSRYLVWHKRHFWLSDMTLSYSVETYDRVACGVQRQYLEFH